VKPAAIAALIFLLSSCRAPEPQRSITIAAAANLNDVFQQLGPVFEAETGVHPIFSFASTAQLTQQIENSAPFDLFAAADSEHVEQLDRRGLLLPGTKAVYARGVLALWVPMAGEQVKTVQDLVSPKIGVIAIAKPELAPYGQAAVETLNRAGIWEKVKARVVYAENISVAKQYGASRNADAVFTAYSLVVHENGTVLKVDESLHQPIDQELGIPANTAHADGARKFAAFLLTGKGRDGLAEYGYQTAGIR